MQMILLNTTMMVLDPFGSFVAVLRWCRRIASRINQGAKDRRRFAIPSVFDRFPDAHWHLYLYPSGRPKFTESTVPINLSKLMNLCDNTCIKVMSLDANLGHMLTIIFWVNQSSTTLLGSSIAHTHTHTHTHKMGNQVTFCSTMGHAMSWHGVGWGKNDFSIRLQECKIV